jgi:hypothetical protein
MAIMHRLVDFFGGILDYNDCDDIDNNYEVEAKSWEDNRPSDGEAWYRLQNRILDLKPITEEEWRSYDKVAYYKIEEST